MIFAIDSIPAVLAITTDTFLIFAANAFALLGLRALYFLLDGMAQRFEYLHYGLGALLIFVGVKMLVEDIVGHLPVGVSLGVIVITLGASVGASLLLSRNRGAVRGLSACVQVAGELDHDEHGEQPGDRADPVRDEIAHDPALPRLGRVRVVVDAACGGTRRSRWRATAATTRSAGSLGPPGSGRRARRR